MKIWKLLVPAMLLCISLQAAAGPATDALGACLADNTSGKDRKDLAKWIFVAMSVHPEIKEFSVASDKARDQLDQTMAALLTRLITENCVQQAAAASKQDGAESFKTAFSALGALAMQELMSNPNVLKSISGFEKYLDKKKFEDAFKAK